MTALFADHPKHKLTHDDVAAMVSAGILAEDEPVELLDGELVVMSPQGPVHASVVVALRRMLEAAYRESAHARDHSPIDAGRHSIPEPDICVVRGDWRAFQAHYPPGEDVILAVEIADSSHTTDRRKANVYAAAGVATYWMVDIPGRRVEVRTEPRHGEYAAMRWISDDQEVALPGIDATLPVAGFLPD